MKTFADLLKKYAPKNYQPGDRLELMFLPLAGVNFKGANLQGIDFSESDLRGANFIGACAQGTNFFNVDLQDACFDNANLQEACFDEADCTRASFKKADMRGISCYFASFYDANLDDADFRGVDLSETSIYNARTRGTRFTLPDVSLSEVKLGYRHEDVIELCKTARNILDSFDNYDKLFDRLVEALKPFRRLT